MNKQDPILGLLSSEDCKWAKQFKSKSTQCAVLIFKKKYKKVLQLKTWEHQWVSDHFIEMRKMQIKLHMVALVTLYKIFKDIFKENKPHVA